MTSARAERVATISGASKPAVRIFRRGMAVLIGNAVVVCPHFEAPNEIDKERFCPAETVRQRFHGQLLELICPDASRDKRDGAIFHRESILCSGFGRRVWVGPNGTFSFRQRSGRGSSDRLFFREDL